MFKTLFYHFTRFYSPFRGLRGRIGGIFLFLSLTLSATPYLSRHYAYRYFSTRDGLAQMQVMCAFQDSDGFMWFGTKGGVSRWDGISFKNYTPENGLPLGETVSISECGNRKLIFSSRKMAILEQNDSIYVQDLPSKMIFPGLSQRTIAIDNENILILGLHEEFNEMLDKRFNYIYNFAQQKFTQIRNLNKKTIRVFYNHIITTTGLYEWTGKVIKLKFRFPYAIEHALFDKNLKKCALIKTKSNTHGLFEITNAKFNQISELREGGLERSSWLSDGSFLWLYFNNHSFTPSRSIRLYDNFTYPNFSFVDKEQNLWIGTENGLYNFFNLDIQEYNFKVGEPDNIWSIVEDNSGTMWLGSYGNGLFTIDKKSKLKQIDISAHYEGSEKLANKLLYMGSTWGEDGAVYMTNCNGLARFVNGKFEKESGTRACLYAYYDRKINEIMYSGIDTSINRRGLFIGMDANKKFYPFEKGFPICIIRDGNDKIRVGAFRGSGWFENGKLVADTVKRNYTGVVSMGIDNQKRLWKATEKGIYVELLNGREFRISPKQLTGAFTSLAVYKNKYLIVGGTHGFAIVDIRTNSNYENLAVVNVGYEGGFTGLESGQNGICVDSQGYVWLATALNVLKFNPDEIIKNQLQHLPKLRINQLSYSSDNTNWQSHFFSDGTAKIASDNKFFRIDYIANSISAPKSLRFRYRLVGLSDEWSEPVYTKSVSYTNIGFGKYRFEVKCSMDGMKWSPVVQSPAIVITVPFYLRPIAFTFYLLLIIALSIYFTRKLTKQKQAKQLQEIKRTKLENELQLNTLRSKIIPHFTKNVLSAIGHFAMTDKLKAGHFISVFSKFTSLTLSNADKNYVSLQEEMDYIEKYLELEKMRFGNKFDYKIHIDKNVKMDLLIPTMTLHTYCDNAIRHGLVPREEGGKLFVEVRKTPEGVLIVVCDNGVGRQRAKELGTQGNGQGLKLAEAQLDFYNHTNEHKMHQHIVDLTDQNGLAMGTRVDLLIPFGYRFE